MTADGAVAAPMYSAPAGGGEALQVSPDRVPTGAPPPPAPHEDSFPVTCPACAGGSPNACLACQGHGVIHLLAELRTLTRSRASVLAGIRQLAVEFGQVAPGAFLLPGGQVVYGVDTGRRLHDQRGHEPPRPRALRHLRVVQ